MLTTRQKIGIYALAITGVVVIIGVSLNISSRRNLADVRTLSELRTLSYALEQYKQEFWRYPVAQNIDLRSAIMLSENGFAPGENVYYRGTIPSKKSVRYQGDESRYTISFTLRKKWENAGIENRACVIRETYKMSCAEE